ncbi:hypothetical protein VOLCADRAFT_92418 [Volvox carteri f. nagariensis]|uniref:Uncharacterized protein n=1 Tax=Volvox carteri f. nagariensis TaxID=3068 RepID=D8TZL9_VOLCA|nr:uncharacterized protein VOLCADRAFT_92418 [Volvox carteri f. nagariensis]EFJ46950.1 hypothetical protein VOLCADRAFT_92418 [Volvox carteri f. nagariensis]|eukprot:XP_002951845.1 hypothetical protein VOLCADRAFT_92418 [Volvox carteri f. nagariensis]
MDSPAIPENCEASGASSICVSDGMMPGGSLEWGPQNSRVRLKRTASSEALDARQPSRSKAPWSLMEEATLAMRHAQLGNRYAVPLLESAGFARNNSLFFAQVGCNSKVFTWKNSAFVNFLDSRRWHSTLRAKSCRRSSLLYTYTRVVRDCCDDSQARKAAFEKAQQLCTDSSPGQILPDANEAAGAATAPQQPVQPPVQVHPPPAPLPLPRGAVHTSSGIAVPLDAEQQALAAAAAPSPWHAGTAVTILDPFSADPSASFRTDYIDTSSSSATGIWPREYNAASIARVAAGVFTPGSGGVGGGTPLTRLGNAPGSGSALWLGVAGDGSACISQPQPQNHMLMRTVSVQPGRPLSYGVEQAAAAMPALGGGCGGHGAVFTTVDVGVAGTAAAAGDLTCINSTMSGNSTTCVARLAQLVLSVDAAAAPSLPHAQQQQQLQQDFQLQSQQQQQQAGCGASVSGPGGGAGGLVGSGSFHGSAGTHPLSLDSGMAAGVVGSVTASGVECMVPGYPSTLGGCGAGPLMSHGLGALSQLPCMMLRPVVHPGVAEQHAPPHVLAAGAAAAAAALGVGGVGAGGGVGHRGGGGGGLQPPMPLVRGPLRTSSDAAVLSAAWDRHTGGFGCGGGGGGGAAAAVDSMLRFKLGLTAADQAAAAAATTVAGGGGMRGGLLARVNGSSGDGGGSGGCFGGLERQLGGGGSLSAPPSTVGPFLTTDGAFGTAVRHQMQLLRSPNVGDEVKGGAQMWISLGGRVPYSWKISPTGKWNPKKRLGRRVAAVAAAAAAAMGTHRKRLVAKNELLTKAANPQSPSPKKAEGEKAEKKNYLAAEMEGKS